MQINEFSYINLLRFHMEKRTYLQAQEVICLEKVLLGREIFFQRIDNSSFIRTVISPSVKNSKVKFFY